MGIPSGIFTRRIKISDRIERDIYARDLTLVATSTFPLNSVRCRPSFSPLALLPRIHNAATLSSPRPPSAHLTKTHDGVAHRFRPSVSRYVLLTPRIPSHCKQDPLLSETPIRMAVAMAAALKLSLISNFLPSHFQFIIPSTID